MKNKRSPVAQKIGRLATFLTTDQISETNAIPFYGMLLTFPPRFVGMRFIKNNVAIVFLKNIRWIVYIILSWKIARKFL